MTPAVATSPGQDDAARPLRDAFLRWQCRVRQMMMRDEMGRPGDGIMPEVRIDGDALGHIITVMSKQPAHSVTPEMMHMAKKTQDPHDRRENALRFFSATYFQKADTFSDILTATFPPGSPGAARIRAAERVVLGFAAFGQTFDITAKVWKLAKKNPFHQATYWHNLLFNPGLDPETVILGFEPDWAASTADPAPKGGR